MDSKNREKPIKVALWRPAVIAGVMVLCGVAVVLRAAEIQLLDNDFYQQHAQSRQQRVKEMKAPRGVIADRNGHPIAVSTPTYAIWGHPGKLLEAPQRLPELADLLELPLADLNRLLESRRDKPFMHLRRHAAPHIRDAVREARFEGVGFDREFHRFYPEVHVFSQVLGFTDVDDHGQEGIELYFDDWLSGEDGAKRVVQDNRYNVISDLELIRSPQAGKSLTLTLDRRLQYLTYRELQKAVDEYQAKSGSAVVLDPATGEILAMATVPSFNPNNRSGSDWLRGLRNRSITDVVEPGSTIKPFAVAAALDSGKAWPKTEIDTSPGWLSLGRHQVRDHRDYGVLNLTEILRKSSNVGTTKLALRLDDNALPELLIKCGFGEATGVQFPGESTGTVPIKPRWSDIERATLSFGYGMSATLLQLARAYTVFANGGEVPQLRLLRQAETPVLTRAMSAETAERVLRMMEAVVSVEGTALKAAIPGYRVAGKTGTVKKVGANGYEDKRYQGLFAGVVPVSRPRFVMAVMLDEPSVQAYYGGVVAAPVFAEVMKGALRLFNVSPDDLSAVAKASLPIQREAL